MSRRGHVWGWLKLVNGYMRFIVLFYFRVFEISHNKSIKINKRGLPHLLAV